MCSRHTQAHRRDGDICASKPRARRTIAGAQAINAPSKTVVSNRNRRRYGYTQKGFLWFVDVERALTSIKYSFAICLEDFDPCSRASRQEEKRMECSKSASRSIKQREHIQSSLILYQCCKPSHRKKRCTLHRIIITPESNSLLLRNRRPLR
jgi:hypothetical protein